MNNFMISFKKFIKNRNTVTVIGIVIILVVLYFGYNSRINDAVKPISIPVATREIGPYQQITKDDVKYIQVSNVAVNENVVRTSNKIVDMYTKLNVTIPEGSMFYSEWLSTEENLPGKWIENVKFDEGEEAYYMPTNVTQTLGNSVIPESYIDIYMKATNDDGLVMYGKFLENIQILVVHDSSGNDVFASSEGTKKPSFLGFAVQQEYYLLLKKIEYLEGVGIELVIAPHGTDVEDLGDIAVRSEDLRDYVISRTAEIDTDKEIAVEKENIETEQNTTVQEGTTVVQ